MTVDLMTQLQRYGSVMDDAVAPMDVDSIHLMDGAVPAQLEPQSRAPRLRPISVAAVAFAGVLVAGLLLWSAARPGPGGDPTNEPGSTITPSTLAITQATPEIDPVLGVPYEPVIPFRATIELTDAPDGDFVIARTPILEVTHGGIVVDGSGARSLVGLRVDVVRGAVGELRPDLDAPEIDEATFEPPEFPPSEASFVVVAEGRGATYFADRNLFVTWLGGPFDAGELAWRTWSEHCSLGELEVVGSDVISSREATHVRCVRTSGAVDVWVDNESGIVLQSRGDTWSVAPMFGHNLGAFPASFTVTDLSFDPGADAGDFNGGAPPGADVIEADERQRRLLAANPDTPVDEIMEPDDGSLTHPLVGAQAPPLQGTTPSGDAFDLADHRGTGVVVLWWASWCPPALEALDVIQATSLIRDDLVFVGAAFLDQPEGIREVIATGGITIAVVDATAHQRQWDLEGCPTTFLIDPDGTVVSILEPYDTVEDLLAQL